MDTGERKGEAAQEEFDFEFYFGDQVLDLFVQIGEPGHSRDWLIAAAQVLTDEAVGLTGLDEETVKSALSDAWQRIGRVGPVNYELHLTHKRWDKPRSHQSQKPE